MATTFGTEDFIIDESKRTSIEKYLKKIERIFHVTVSFDAVSEEGGSKKQWIVVSGTETKRRKAKNYILAMCYPEQTMQITCEDSVGLDDIVLQEVEQKTSAFLQQVGPLCLEVKGTELACALAVSQLEQTYTVIVGKVTVNADDMEPSVNSKTMAEARSALNASPTDMSSRVQTLSMDGASGSCSTTIDCDSDQVVASGSAAAFSTKAPCHQFHIDFPPQAKIKTKSKGTRSSSSGRKPNRVSASEPVSGSATAVNVKAPHHRFHVEFPPHTSINNISSSLSSALQSQAGAASGSASSIQPIRKVSAQPKTESSENKSGCSSMGISGQTEEKLPQTNLWKDQTPKAEKQRAYFLKISQGLGYLESDVLETLHFFDFTQQSVDNREFLCALDQVRANNRAKRDGSDLSSSSRKTVGESTKGARKENKKGGKIQLPSPNPSKTNLRKSPAKHHDITPAASYADKQMGKKKGKSSSTDSGVFEGEHLDRSSQVPSGSADDSVICLGDVLDDSVYIVDAYPVASGAAGHPDEDPGLSSHRTGRKRKDYSDDEEQTCVMKPCSSVQPTCKPRQQEADSTPDAKTAGPVTELLPPRNAEAVGDKDNGLRYIVIDGSNVAMSHGNDKVYSCRGIKLCVDYFVKRGHRVKAFVPLTKTYKNQPGHLPPMQNQEILDELKQQGYLEFTPARTLNNKHVVSHDDYFILGLAQLEDAVIVSRDNFKEFVGEFHHIIENRLLSYVFSDDHFMLPRDPLGRYGPTLEEFLRKPPRQNPTRPAAALTYPGINSNAAAANSATSLAYPATGRSIPASQSRMLAAAKAGPHLVSQPKIAGHAKRFSGAPSAWVQPAVRKQASPVPRHQEVTLFLLQALKTMFPEEEQEEKIRQVLDNHQGETDLNKLTNYCISALSL